MENNPQPSALPKVNGLALFDQLTALLKKYSGQDGNTLVKNVLIREGEPIRVEVPSGLIEVTYEAQARSVEEGVETITLSGGERDVSEVWSQTDLVSFFLALDFDWAKTIVDGAIDRPVSMGDSRLRANLFTYDGEFRKDQPNMTAGKLGMALRVFPQAIPKLSALGMPAGAAERVTAKTGLILLAGGTGAGKSTTAASMIDHVNATRTGHIITVENPIEFNHKGRKCVITQREVGTNVKNMARGVYDAMREFPIGILIGEIRDEDAADAAMYAGESGHLVFGTLHSNSAPGALSKMVGFFSGSEAQRAMALAQSLQVVVAQTLVPSLDANGWVPIFETIVVSEVNRDLIANAKWQGLKELLRDGAPGMVSLNHSLFHAVNKKQITRDSAMQYSYDRSHMQQLLK